MVICREEQDEHVSRTYLYLMYMAVEKASNVLHCVRSFEHSMHRKFVNHVYKSDWKQIFRNCVIYNLQNQYLGVYACVQLCV